MEEGKAVFRSIALHTISQNNYTSVDEELSYELFKHTHADLHALDIQFCIGQRVRVTDNLATQLGVYNGATGTIHSFGFVNPAIVTEASLNPSGAAYQLSVTRDSEYPIIFVQMDKVSIDHHKQSKMDNSACSLEYSCDNSVERLLPFTLEPCKFTVSHQNKKYVRYQYCLLPANASTAHKAQGMTAHKGTVLDISINDFKAHGMAYTGASRNTKADNMVSLHTLLPDQFLITKTYKDAIQNEYDRLRNMML
jgi:hypothetical protein